ncbi:hypothetical protein JZ751_012959 [Albula glossodonta]|uniref:AMP-binding enzyme C-terminal domain-containing protein n=1 Tax=Albula glossodonta TaxID=121402 RepID=A0A8T2MY46_9TELE|nr:hypothetical protein JZ751_012959 [Albula glossodonta]
MCNVCSGHLLSTAEVESALVEHPAVSEAAVVGRPHPVKGESLYCFVTLSDGIGYTPALEAELKKQELRQQVKVSELKHLSTNTQRTQDYSIWTRVESPFTCFMSLREKIGAIATPDYMQNAPGLPKTRSGKIMRRVLRKIARNERDLGDVSTLADSSVIEQLFNNRCVTAVATEGCQGGAGLSKSCINRSWEEGRRVRSCAQGQITVRFRVWVGTGSGSGSGLSNADGSVSGGQSWEEQLPLGGAQLPTATLSALGERTDRMRFRSGSHAVDQSTERYRLTCQPGHQYYSPAYLATQNQQSQNQKQLLAFLTHLSVRFTVDQCTSIKQITMVTTLLRWTFLGREAGSLRSRRAYGSTSRRSNGWCRAELHRLPLAAVVGPLAVAVLRDMAAHYWDSSWPKSLRAPGTSCDRPERSRWVNQARWASLCRDSQSHTKVSSVVLRADGMKNPQRYTPAEIPAGVRESYFSIGLHCLRIEADEKPGKVPAASSIQSQLKQWQSCRVCAEPQSAALRLWAPLLASERDCGFSHLGGVFLGLGETEVDMGQPGPHLSSEDLKRFSEKDNARVNDSLKGNCFLASYLGSLDQADG